jgi:hypothetical protein
MNLKAFCVFLVFIGLAPITYANNQEMKIKLKLPHLKEGNLEDLLERRYS